MSTAPNTPMTVRVSLLMQRGIRFASQTKHFFSAAFSKEVCMRTDCLRSSINNVDIKLYKDFICIRVMFCLQALKLRLIYCCKQQKMCHTLTNRRVDQSSAEIYLYDCILPKSFAQYTKKSTFAGKMQGKTRKQLT